MKFIKKSFFHLFLGSLWTGTTYTMHNIEEKIQVLDFLMTGEGVVFSSYSTAIILESPGCIRQISFTDVINLHGNILATFNKNKKIKTTYKNQKRGILHLINRCRTAREFTQKLLRPNVLFLQKIRLNEFYQGKDLAAHQYDSYKSEEIVGYRKEIQKLFNPAHEENFPTIKNIYETQRPCFATYETFESFITRYYFQQKRKKENKISSYNSYEQTVKFLRSTVNLYIPS